MYADVGEISLYYQKNCVEIYPGDLRRSGTFNPIIVDISTTRHLIHRGCVCGSGENDLGILFSLSFLQKDENPFTHCRNSKYDANQGGWTGPPGYSDVIKGKIPKLSDRLLITCLRFLSSQPKRDKNYGNYKNYSN